MAVAPDKRPIIIVKRRKSGGGGHHGGAWKVAYADFVTAMMAFFMVMWLVASVNKEQKAAIFDYFKNPSMENGRAPKPAKGQDGPGGASTSPINLQGGLDSPRSKAEPGDSLTVDPKSGTGVADLDVEEAKRIAEAAEKLQLESLMEDLKRAVAMSQALAPFKDQLLLDITPEGLRIQIVDAMNRPMFDLGSARLKLYTGDILKELAVYLDTVPNRLSLTGHTDMKPYPGRGGYTNWELSADRANAARRALEAGGLTSEKVARVVGLASSVLYDKANPESPVNRRISIIVMTKKAEESALKTDSPAVAAATATDEPAGASTEATETVETAETGESNAATAATNPSVPVANVPASAG